MTQTKSANSTLRSKVSSAVSRRTFRYLGVLSIVVLGATCASTAKPAPASGTAPATPTQPKKHWYQIGRASWYGGYFQGHATASGENYNMTDLTCAHRSLPIGTLIRVTNLGNHKSVVVRVNDRGPYLASRVVDLSYAAAHFLGFNGTTKVRLDVLNTNTEVASVSYPAVGIADEGTR
jgi:rare lipoprotein A